MSPHHFPVQSGVDHVHATNLDVANPVGRVTDFGRRAPSRVTAW
jgi:hypothetical protein